MLKRISQATSKVENVERLVLCLFVGDGFEVVLIRYLLEVQLLLKQVLNVVDTESSGQLPAKFLVLHPTKNQRQRPTVRSIPLQAFPHRNGYHSRPLVVSVPPIHPKAAKAPPRPSRELPKRPNETRKAQTWRHLQKAAMSCAAALQTKSYEA